MPTSDSKTGSTAGTATGIAAGAGAGAATGAGAGAGTALASVKREGVADAFGGATTSAGTSLQLFLMTNSAI